MPEHLISYAQNREDLILYVLLHSVKEGFYVDVGANDPVIGSVTKFFYDRGWHGINIEPLPSLYTVVSKKRRRDININAAISNQKGQLKLREYGNGKHGWSTLSEDSKATHQSERNYKDYEVEVKTLKDIFEENKITDIDFLKVDVEGFEYEVLSGNDWQRYRPRIILVEDTSPEKWTGILAGADYQEVYHDGLNRYFVRTDLLDRHTMSDYVKVLLDGAVLLSADHAAALKQLRATQGWLKATQAELRQERDLHQNALRRLQALYGHPEIDLGIKSLATALARRLRQKIRNSS